MLKNSIMYTSRKLRYGHFKMQQVLYIVLYSFNRHPGAYRIILVQRCDHATHAAPSGARACA